MTTQLILFGIIFVCFCALFVTLFLRSFYEKAYIKALVFKGVASLCFVVFGAVNCFCTDFSVPKLLIFIGLCLGIIGDELIALCQVLPERDTLAFVSGGSSFLLGHILYIAALLLVGRVNWIVVAITFVIGAGASLLYERQKCFLTPEMKKPLMLYLAIVILMMSVATGLFAARGRIGAALFILGGLGFTVSDNILFAYKLGKEPRFLQNIILHITYYAAQLAISWSISLL